MRGMYRFSCGHAYSAHSNTAGIGSDSDVGVEPIQFLSYLHNANNQTAEERGPEQPPITPAHELVPGVRIDGSFDVFVICIAFMVLFSACIGCCFVISWISPKPAPQPTPAVYAEPMVGSGFSARTILIPANGGYIYTADPGYASMSRLRTSVVR